MTPDDATPRARQLSDSAASLALAGLTGPYLPWSSGAMRPAGLVTVCNDVVLRGRRHVVELGSGISTVLLARLLHQRPPRNGCRLVAVEHDERWAQWVTDQLEREGTGTDVEVVHAPLSPCPVADLPWYDVDVLTAALDHGPDGDAIDLLVVDGPPAYDPGLSLARYPALAVLADRLAPGATVVLDDVERPGEQEVLRRWERETRLTFDRGAHAAGIAVATVAARVGRG